MYLKIYRDPENPELCSIIPRSYGKFIVSLVTGLDGKTFILDPSLLGRNDLAVWRMTDGEGYVVSSEDMIALDVQVSIVDDEEVYRIWNEYNRN